jgi:hypothetical protein
MTTVARGPGLATGMMPAVTSPPDAGTPPGSDSRTGTADAPVPPLRLRPPSNQVDRRAIRLWSVHAGLAALAGVAAVAVAAALVEPARAWGSVTTAVAAAVGVAYVVAMPRIRYRVHRWEVTDEAVYTKSGWLTHEWRVAPLSRVQTVDARRGPLQQVFGLSSVRITTASAAGDVAIDGLDHLLAAELVETLTERTQATPGDAT